MRLEKTKGSREAKLGKKSVEFRREREKCVGGVNWKGLERRGQAVQQSQKCWRRWILCMSIWDVEMEGGFRRERDQDPLQSHTCFFCYE